MVGRLFDGIAIFIDVEKRRPVNSQITVIHPQFRRRVELAAMRPESQVKFAVYQFYIHGDGYISTSRCALWRGQGFLGNGQHGTLAELDFAAAVSALFEFESRRTGDSIAVILAFVLAFILAFVLVALLSKGGYGCTAFLNKSGDGCVHIIFCG